MEEKDDVFEGFDLTQMEGFTSFLEERDNDSSNDDDTNGQQRQDDDYNPFVGFDTSDDDSQDDDSDVDTDNNDDADPSSSDTKKPQKDSFLTPYAKLLMDEGVLQDFDIEKFDGTADGLVDAFRQQLTRHVEEYKQTLDPRVKWLQDHVEMGVPLETLLNIDKERVELSKITPELLSSNEDVQKDIVRRYLKNTTNGWSDAKIEKEVGRLADLGELADEAKESFELLKQIDLQREAQLAQEAQQMRDQALQQQQEALNNFKSTLDKTTEIIPGLQVTPIVRDKIFKMLTTPVAQDNNGTPLNVIAKARAENPMDFEIKLAYLFEITKGFSNWDALGTKGKKSAIKEFEEAARAMDMNKQQGGGSAPVYDKASQKEILKAMGMFGR